MAPEWEMDMGFGTGPYSYPAAAAVAPPAYLYGLPSADTLRIDDLLDFSNQDLFPSSATNAITDAHLLPQPPEHSSAGGGGGGCVSALFARDADSSSSQQHQLYPHLNAFPDLYIPSEEAAELEWLSKFVDDSFSDIPNYSSCDLVAPSPANTYTREEPSAQGERSKRSRSNAAAANNAWFSLKPQPQSSSSATSSSSSSEFPPANPQAGASNENNSSGTSSSSKSSHKGKKGMVGEGVDGGVRRCTHCASEKTPQWRTGPLGPKTLCNACGVRFKSGRLVPEYRPAASPTFVLTQHSNSHRKVLELRRQKELLLSHQTNSASAAAAPVPRPDLLFHDYEVC